jgi:hypothetical protein
MLESLDFWLLHLSISETPVAETSSDVPISWFRGFKFRDFGSWKVGAFHFFEFSVSESMIFCHVFFLDRWYRFFLDPTIQVILRFRISQLRDSCSGSFWHLQLLVSKISVVETPKWSLTNTSILPFDHRCTTGLPCLVVFHQINKHTFTLCSTLR